MLKTTRGLPLRPYRPDPPWGGATDDEAGCVREGGIGAVEPDWTVGARELGSRRSVWPLIYFAAGDGRDAPVMVTSASEVLSAPLAGCRIDEPAGGALTWCFRLRSVRSPRRQSAHRTHRPLSGLDPRPTLPAGRPCGRRRRGMAKRAELNQSGTVQEACVSRLWERRERSASGALSRRRGWR